MIPAPPEPSIVAPAPLRVIAPVVPLKVPFTRRLPPTPMVYVKPANVEPVPIERSPEIARLAAAVVDTAPPKVKLPLIVVMPACKMSVPLPLRVRL